MKFAVSPVSTGLPGSRAPTGGSLPPGRVDLAAYGVGETHPMGKAG